MRTGSVKATPVCILFNVTAQNKTTMEDLTIYDKKPAAMENYLRYHGTHFNKALCEFAVSRMKATDNTGKRVKITPYTKEEVDALLRTHGVEVKEAQLYDTVFVANMAKADYLGRSVHDTAHLAMFVKDYIDDPDGYEGLPFNRWYADCAKTGVAIPWEDVV